MNKLFLCPVVCTGAPQNGWRSCLATLIVHRFPSCCGVSDPVSPPHFDRPIITHLAMALYLTIIVYDIYIIL